VYYLCEVTRVIIGLRHRRSAFGRPAFSAAGPIEWNWLLDSLRDPALESRQLQIGSEDLSLHSAKERVAH